MVSYCSKEKAPFGGSGNGGGGGAGHEPLFSTSHILSVCPHFRDPRSAITIYLPNRQRIIKILIVGLLFVFVARALTEG